MIRFRAWGKKQYKLMFCVVLLVLGAIAFSQKPAIAIETSTWQTGESAVRALKTGFTDLDNDKQLLPFVRYLAAKGIINGFPDGTFRPADSLTRAEAAKILVLTKGLPEQSDGQPVFSDVPTGYWAFGTIQAAKKAGLLYGYEDGTFKPEEPVTRAEAIALLLRISGGALTYKNIDIADVDPAGWAYRPVVTAVEAGIVDLSADRRFNPDAPFRRGDLATGLSAVLTLGPGLRETDLVGELTVKEGKATITAGSETILEAGRKMPVQANVRINTGAKSKAEISFDDGSGILLDENTEITITESKGCNYIRRDGSPGVAIDELKLSLKGGRILGALATGYENEKLPLNQDEKSSLNSVAKDFITLASRELSSDLGNFLLAAEENAGDNQETAWWQEPYAERERVVVDMPWSVASVRGTFWLNEVGAKGEGSAVIIGHAVVSSAGRSVSLGAGQASTVGSANTAPEKPGAFTEQMKQSFANERSWVLDRARTIQNNLPQPPALNSTMQQPQNNVAGVVANALDRGITGAALPNNQGVAPNTGGGGSGGSTAGPDTQAPVWDGGALLPSNITDSGLTLTWSGATDNVAVTGYALYMNGSLYASLAETTLNVTGLTAGTSYSFIIEARDAAGNLSSDGPAIEITTALPPNAEGGGSEGSTAGPDTQAPVWAAGGALLPSDITENGLTLTWNGATDDTLVAGYELNKDDVQIAVTPGDTAVDTYDYAVTGLAPDTSYEFSVRAVDGAGNRSSELTTTVTTEALTDSQTPAWTDGAITPSDITANSVTLTWSGAADNVGVTGYMLYMNGTAYASVAGTTYSVSGLGSDTLYTFKVEAGDAAGNWSSTGPTTSMTTTTAPDSQTPAWTGGAITPSDITANSVTLTWSGAADNVGVTGYMLYMNGTAYASVAGTTYSVSGLGSDTLYTFKVEAGDAAGNWSSTGPTTSVTTTTAPDSQAPAWTGGAITPSGITAGSVTLTWSGATDNVAVTGYKLYMNNVFYASVAGTTCSVSGLSPDTAYSFRVEAGDAAGNWSSTGPTTSVTTTTAPDTQAPAWPGGWLGAAPWSITSTSVTLSWSGARCRTGVTGYRLYMNGIQIIELPNINWYIVTGLSPGTTYTFRVEACNPAGHWSSRGPTIQVRTASLADTQAPTWPGGWLAAAPWSITSTSVTLTWSGARDNFWVTGYRLYKDGELVADILPGVYSYTVFGLNQNTSYTFSIEAVDAAGNWSNSGPTARIKTKKTHRF